MKQTPRHLQDHLGFWLRRLSNAVSQSFAERLAKHEISVPNWVVLRVLFEREAMTLKEVVKEVGVDQGSLSRMIERLVARGLVSRGANPRSRREVAISLTPGGRKLVPKLAREADENDQAFFGGLAEAEREALLGTIKKLLSLNPNAAAEVPMH